MHQCLLSRRLSHDCMPFSHEVWIEHICTPQQKSCMMATGWSWMAIALDQYMVSCSSYLALSEFEHRRSCCHGAPPWWRSGRRSSSRPQAGSSQLEPAAERASRQLGVFWAGTTRPLRQWHNMEQLHAHELGLLSRGATLHSCPGVQHYTAPAGRSTSSYAWRMLVRVPISRGDMDAFICHEEILPG